MLSLLRCPACPLLQVGMSHIPVAAAAEALPQVSSGNVMRHKMHGLQEQGAAVAAKSTGLRRGLLCHRG